MGKHFLAKLLASAASGRATQLDGMDSTNSQHTTQTHNWLSASQPLCITVHTVPKWFPSDPGIRELGSGREHTPPEAEERSRLR
jgi:hypothetical protein